MRKRREYIFNRRRTWNSRLKFRAWESDLVSSKMHISSPAVGLMQTLVTAAELVTGSGVKWAGDKRACVFLGMPRILKTGPPPPPPAEAFSSSGEHSGPSQ